MSETIKQQLENADRLKEQGQLDAAIAAYQNIIQLEPQNHQSYQSLGAIFLEQEKYDEAEKVYRQAIELNRNHAWWHCNLGRSLLNQEKVDAAIPCFRKAMELDSKIAEFYFYLGTAFGKQNDFEQATTFYRKAIELEPGKFLYHHQLGDCFLFQKKYEEAISSYRQSIELNPSYAWSYCNWGNALSKLNCLDEAVAIYLKALKQIPGLSNLFSKLAIAQSQISDEQITANPTFSYLSKLRQLFQSEVARADRNRTVVTSVSPVEQSIFPELDDSGFIAWIFENLLKRSAADSEIDLFLKHFEKGTFSRASALENILKSQEFSDRSGTIGKAITPKDSVLLSNLEDEAFVKYLYSTFLRRPADEEGLAACVEALKNNVSRSIILENIITSEEFSNVTSQGSTEVAVRLPSSASHIIFAEMSDRKFIEYVYVTFLKHLPSEQALIGNLEALLNDTPRTVLLESILKSEEFAAVNQQQILEGFSDREFLHIIWEILLGVVCNVNAERHHLNLFDAGLSRSEIALGLMKSNDFLERVKILPVSGDTSSIPKKNSAHILGTNRVINQDEWNHILLEALLEYEVSDKNESLENRDKPKKAASPDFYSHFKKSGKSSPLVSIITSLYKGKKFIDHFMKNITSQTIFRDCELIIIDANSPEGEYDAIEQYMDRFENINYIRTDEVIGIYDAWNLGVQNSKGAFLTNANLDDLRSPDCLEKQSIALMKNDNVDVVYQDVYYTFTPNLPFDVVAKCDVKSKLPMATKANMLQFNSPHNAPMWRKSLHNKIGLFNTRYKSAGDYELWLRAMLNGSKFLKIEEPLAAYYNNPFGISTRSETSGVKEAIEIQRIYVKLFGASFFAMAKEDFMNFCYSSFGLSEKMQQEQSLEKWQDKETFLYQVFNRKLQSLAEGKFFVSLEDIAG